MLSSKCPKIPPGFKLQSQGHFWFWASAFFDLVQFMDSLSIITYIWCWTMKTRWELILFPKFLAETKTKRKVFFFFFEKYTNRFRKLGFLHHNNKNHHRCKIGQLFFLWVFCQSIMLLACLLSVFSASHSLLYLLPISAHFWSYSSITKCCVYSFMYLSLISLCSQGLICTLCGLPRFPKATHLL